MHLWEDNGISHKENSFNFTTHPLLLQIDKFTMYQKTNYQTRMKKYKNKKSAIIMQMQKFRVQYQLVSSTTIKNSDVFMLDSQEQYNRYSQVHHSIVTQLQK